MLKNEAKNKRFAANKIEIKKINNKEMEEEKIVIEKFVKICKECKKENLKIFLKIVEIEIIDINGEKFLYTGENKNLVPHGKGKKKKENEKEIYWEGDWEEGTYFI